MPNRSYSQVASEFRRRLIIAETAAIILTEVIVILIKDFGLSTSSMTGYVDLFILATFPLVWLNFLSMNQSWESQLFLSGSKYYERALSASFKTLVAVATFAYLMKEPISRSLMLLIFGLGTLALLLIRYIFRHNILAGLFRSKIAKFYVVATSQEFDELSEMKDFLGQGNLKLVSKQLENPQCAEEWKNLLSEIENPEWAGIIIGDKYFPENTIFSQISTIQSKRSFEVFIFSDIAQLVPRLSTLENNKLVKLNRPLLVGRYAFIKRLVDVVLSFLALILLSPVFIVTAVLVKATSNGPVLYIDKRIGQDNKLFYFPKFRSMYKDADKVRNQILGTPDAEMPERYKADPRITPFGKFIRRWSIDELPQIYCVLIGTMSLVGPRPILREEDTDVPLESRGRFLAKPGLTGLWQVSGRKEVLWNNRMNQDLLYIESWTLLNDFLLIIKTIGTIISGRGAV